MGLQAVATALSIASAVNSLFNAPKAPKARVMPYAEARTQAGNELNPIYDKRMKDVLKNVQGDLITRGFSGQQAGTELSTETAAENERQRIAAISGLARSIQQGYNDQSYRNAAMEYQSDMNRFNAINAGLSSTADWLSDKQWVKGMPYYNSPNSLDGKKVMLPPGLPQNKWNYGNRRVV